MTILNIHEFGDPAGEPMLAIHGITAHGRRFRRLAEQAWPQRRTIAVDLRGHGRSTYDGPWSIPQHLTDLLDTLDSLGLAELDVVGHSYGGAIGLSLLARAPHRVKRLVMLDPALAQSGEFSTTAALETIAAEGWNSVEEATIARNGGAAEVINPAVIEDIEAHLTLGDDGRYRFRYHKPAVVTGWGELSYPLPAMIEPRPTLLVIAEQAGLVTDQTVAGLEELFGHRLSIVRIDCGHMLYWERFEETADAVMTFFGA